MIQRLLRWLNRRLNIVSHDPYYDWADRRLDEIERDRRGH